MEILQEINKKYSMIAELKLYLNSTDYHILKQVEGNYQAPQDILFQRVEARENINALEREIEELCSTEMHSEGNYPFELTEEDIELLNPKIETDETL